MSKAVNRGKASLMHRSSASQKNSDPEVYTLPDFGKHDKYEQLNLNGAWRSLVAHLLWEQGVGGSNPLAPTKSSILMFFPEGVVNSPCNVRISPLHEFTWENVCCKSIRSQF